jgi:hypothetical protein
VKTRKEAKRMAIMDSISGQKARVEELKRSVQEQKAKRNQYAATVSQQSLGIFLSSCWLVCTLSMYFISLCAISNDL